MHYMATFSRAVGRSENKDGASKGVTARYVMFLWCGSCSILRFAQLACWAICIQNRVNVHQSKVKPLAVTSLVINVFLMEKVVFLSGNALAKVQ